MTSRLALLALLTLWLGCARSGFDLLVRDAERPTNWGDFAATLDVPDCPSSNPVLTVNTAADELDGGQSITDPSQAGDDLSFVEAIWIAANRGTPHNIFFDAEVFPAATPGVIAINTFYEVPQTGTGLCIDGRQRGVRIAYTESAALACQPDDVACGLRFSSGGLLVGVEFETLPDMLGVGGDGRVAGCRLRSQGSDVLVRASGAAQVGPGNTFSGGSLDFWLPRGACAITGNYFGYDPVTRELDNAPPTALNAGNTLEVSENVFGRARIQAFGFDDVVVTRNYAGVDADGTELTSTRGLAPTGLTVLGGTTASAELRVGPANVIRGVVGPGLHISSGFDRGATITRNEITGNDAGIVYDGGTPPAAPIITAASHTSVSGTCAVAGTIEVFSDPGDQGESFLGDVVCNGASPWTLSAAVPGGRNVTATLTDTSGVTSVFSAPFAVP